MKNLSKKYLIEEIQCYKVHVIYGVLLLNKENNLKLNDALITNEASSCGLLWDKYLLYSKRDSNGTFIMNLVNKEPKYFDKIKPQIQLDHERFIAIKREDTKKLIILDLNSNRENLLIENFSFGIKLYNDNLLILSEGKHILKCFNILDNISIWTIDIKNYSQKKDEVFSYVYGIDGYKLILSTSFNTILAIDIISGNILWQLQDWEKDFIFFNEKHKWYNATHNMFIEDGKIYNMSGALYYSIDLETRAVEILWHDERPVDHYFVKYFSYDRDYIYFAGGINISIQANKIGVFNRKTLQVECISDDDLGIDPLHGYAASYKQAPQYGAGKLYGLDTAGNLRIYQVDLS